MKQVLFDIVMKSYFQAMMFLNTEKKLANGNAPQSLFLTRTTTAN